MAAAVVLYFDFTLPVLIFLDSAWCGEPTCQTLSRSVSIWPSYCDFCKINMAPTAILNFEYVFPGLIFHYSAWCGEHTCQISSRSVSIWPSYYDFCKIKMAAADILDFDCTLPVFIYLNSAWREELNVKFHQDRSVFGRVITISVKSRWRPPPSWILISHLRF